MKTFAMILILFSVLACGSRAVENPAADAATFSEEEFEADLAEVRACKDAKANGIEILFETVNGEGSDIYAKSRVRLPKVVNKSEDAVQLRNSLLIEIDRLDRFKTKYRSLFRLRLKDGDLRLKELSPALLKTLDLLRQNWIRSLDEADQLLQ